MRGSTSLRTIRSTLSSHRHYATSPAKPSLNVHAAAGGPDAPVEYCASLVKKLDPDAWLCSYFWPRKEKEWFLAWRAFNLELHLISTTVSQPALAAIRFQFWKDALSTIWTGRTTDGKPSVIPQHPVAVLLGEMKAQRPVQRYYLTQMIDSRAKTLSLPPSSATLEEHLKVHGPQHSAMLLGPLPLLIPPTHPQTSHLTHTLSHLSSLLTTVSLLRNLPVMVTSKRQINIPHEVSQKHGVVEEDVLRNGSSAKGIKDACYEIGTRGMDELITARRELKEAAGRVDPKAAIPIFLSSVPAESYLKRLERADFDVFHPTLHHHDWRLAPRLWWRAQTGRI